MPKRALRRFPVLVEYDEAGELVGLTILNGTSAKKRRGIVASGEVKTKSNRRPRPPLIPP